MRASARALAAVFAWSVVAMIGGCSAAGRPDAAVARRVEMEEHKRVSMVVLASADEELPVAVPVVVGGVAVPPAGATAQPVARVSGDGAPDRFFSMSPDEWPRSFSIVVDGEGRRSAADALASDGGTRSGDGADGKARLGLNLFHLTVAGHPVSLRCSLRNKHLMFGAKIAL